jgi:hypothetical protein
MAGFARRCGADPTRLKLASHPSAVRTERPARASALVSGLEVLADGGLYRTADAGPAKYGIGLFVMTPVHRATRRPACARAKKGRRLGLESSQNSPARPLYSCPRTAPLGYCALWMFT